MPTSTKPDRQNNRHKSPYQIARTISIECHFRASPILEDRNIDKGINMQLVSDSSWYTNKFEYMWYCTFILIYMCTINRTCTVHEHGPKKVIYNRTELNIKYIYVQYIYMMYV